MQIKFSIINTIPKLNLSKRERIPKIHLDSIFDTTEFSSSWQYLSDLLEGMVGEFSKEDFQKAEKYTQKYLQSDANLFELFKTKREEYSQNILKIPAIEKKKFDKNFLFRYIPKKFSNNDYKKLKQSAIELYGLKKAVYKDNPLRTKTPYDYWFDTSLKMQKSSLAQNQFIHPVNRVKKITGDYTRKDGIKFWVYNKLYSVFNNEIMWNKKLKILSKISEYMSKPNSDFTETFTNMDFRRLKNLYIKYDALDNLLTNEDCHTKYLEAVLFSQKFSAESINKGDYINELGLVIEKMKVDNKPVIMTFSDDGNSHILNLYDLEKLTRKNKFLESLPSQISLEQACDLNKRAKFLVDTDYEAMISEVLFSVDSSAEYVKADNRLSKIIGNNANICYISDFENKKKKEFPSGAKVVGVKLLNILKEKICLPIIIEAHAFGNSKHSPVSMYMRLGFEPYSHTKAEILEVMNQNHSEFASDETVKMYFNDFNKIKSRLELLNKVYFGSKA